MSDRPTFETAMDQMRKYCAYQERCHQEVRYKLIKSKIYGDLLEEIISSLIEEDFLNEERYARAYVSGKFRMNQWGRYKIKMGLKQKEISDYLIKKAMEEIDPEDYEETIRILIGKYLPRQKGSDYEKKQKTIKHLMQKGYEYEVVKAVLD